MRVLKWNIGPGGGVIGRGDVVLVGEQLGGLAVWTMEPHQAPVADRRVQVLATGQPAPDDNLEHIGSVQMPLHLGAFVWHLFADPRP